MVLFFADLSFIFARSILMRVWELWVSINSCVSPVLTSKIQSNAMTMSIKFQKQTNLELYKTLMNEWIEFSWEFCEISKKHFFTDHLRWLLLESSLVKAFFNKIVCCVSAKLLWELCHRRFWGIFQNSYFLNFWTTAQLSPGIIIMSLLSLFSLF